jgi:hypothetical protein
VDTFGPNPRGFLMYGQAGRMIVLIATSDRSRPKSIEKMTDQQRADLFRSMVAYTGTYKFDGKSVEHQIDVSWNEVWAGMSLKLAAGQERRQTDLQDCADTVCRRWQAERHDADLGAIELGQRRNRVTNLRSETRSERSDIEV